MTSITTTTQETQDDFQVMEHPYSGEKVTVSEITREEAKELSEDGEDWFCDTPDYLIEQMIAARAESTYPRWF